MRQFTLLLLVLGASTGPIAFGYGVSPAEISGLIDSGELSVPRSSGQVQIVRKHVDPKYDKLDNNSLATQILTFEGDYRWYVKSNADWILEKSIDLTPYGGPGQIRQLIYVPFKDSVLSYEIMHALDKSRGFLAGHLDKRSTARFGTGLLGFYIDSSKISDVVREIENPEITEQGSLITVKGRWKKFLATVLIDKEKNYRARRIEFNQGSYHVGLEITEFAKVGQYWFPKSGQVWDRLNATNGDKFETTYEFTYSNIVLGDEPDWVRALAKPPATAMFGSDNNRLYRVNANGEIVDIGTQGRRSPENNTKWGKVFLASAALLFMALAWRIIVYRKRS